MNTASEHRVLHETLPCGVELAALQLPGRHTVCVELRFLTGFVEDPPDKLGLNYLVEETIAKDTAKRSGRELSDAFDAIGARWSSWAGREATGYHFTCLPEFFDEAFSLHAEYLRTPTFDAEGIQVAVDLSVEEIEHLEDDPQEYGGKLFNRQVYGPVLGRHVLGTPETMASLTHDDVVNHWRAKYHAGRMQLCVVGPLDPQHVVERTTALFEGWGDGTLEGRTRTPWQFEEAFTHHHKELEQEQIGICYEGATLDDSRRFAQRVAMAVLSGGMSCRLFTELREKTGLVYWVTAWTEHPRGVGIVYLGASTTPERCDQTYAALLREVDRLSEDLDEEELQRAIAGLVAKAETRGAVTRAHCSELADGLFHYGRIVPRQEVIAALQAVTLTDVRDYLDAFPRDRLSVLTLGPRELDQPAT